MSAARASGLKAFDRKFGRAFFESLPTSPGVYFFYDESGELIYVGKAKNLRRRLGQYRNAKRRKKHRKMKSIVADAARIELQLCASDLEACLLEARLIQERRPRWNVAGAFYFMYPLLGVRRDERGLHFCYTSEPERLPGFAYHGAYRSRGLTGEAFFSLMRLLAYVGHRTPARKDALPPRYSYVYTFRQLPEPWEALWGAFFKGESQAAVEELVLALVENAGARRARRKVQDELDNLKRFWRHEARALAAACRRADYAGWPVPQKERDVLFVRNRFERAAERERKRPAAAVEPRGP